LSDAAQNNDRAKYLHYGAKLKQPLLVGVRILAQLNDTKDCEKHINAQGDRNKTAEVQTHKLFLSVGPPSNESHGTKCGNDARGGDQQISRIQVSLLMIGMANPVANSADAKSDYQDGFIPGE
jgi:hypothetical protein